VSKAFVGGSPAFTTDATKEKPCFKAYETARGTCNVSGTTVTFVDGEQFPYGTTGDHQYVFLNGIKYAVTAGPEVAGANTLTLATTAGTQTNIGFAYYRQYAPWSYVSLMRLQGIAGGKESVGVFSINTRNEVLIGAAATHQSLVGNMRVEAPRIRIGMGEQWPYNGTTDSYGIEVISPWENQAFGGHYVSLGGYNGRDAMRVVTWNAYTDHLTVFGSVSGVNSGPAIKAEGSSTNLDIQIAAKGLGGINFTNHSNASFFKVLNYGTTNRVEVGSGDSGYSPTFRARGGNANVGLGFDTQGSGSFTFTSNSFGAVEFLVYGVGGSSHLAAASSHSGAPSLSAVGSSSNVDIALLPKGSGRVWVGPWTTHGDAVITGYITVKDSAGVQRYLACIG
jgi:hypothetical protein